MAEIKSVNLKVSEETIKKYTGIVPNELIEIWKEYGYAELLDGYLRLINPDDYKELIEETYFFGKKAVPIMTTAFGDVLTFEDSKYIAIVRYRYDRFNVISAEFEMFLRRLDHSTYLEDKFELDKYKEAVEVLGKVEHDECFCYVPLLGLGGPEKVSNIKKGKTREHIEIITQLVGKIGVE